MTKWTIELDEEQLQLISDSLEFTSRFACGQIGSSYLPWAIRVMLYSFKDPDRGDRREMFDSLGHIAGGLLHPDIAPYRNMSLGVGAVEYADRLYDMYKAMNHAMWKKRSEESPSEFDQHSVHSSLSNYSKDEPISVAVVK